MRYLFLILLFTTFSNAHTQTLGGNTAYNFLKLPPAVALTAAGGVNTSFRAPDVSLALNNPALLLPVLHQQISLNFTQLPAGIKAYQLAGAYQHSKWNTTLGAQIFFINYGHLQATDASGNLLGRIHANDYVAQVSAGRQYEQKWHYGASLKFIHSSYPPYRSSAVAADVGVNYFDSAKGLSLSVLAKNMGAPLKSYAGESDELPFHLELGFTKKLANAPLAFSITVQQAHRFNLLYNDTTFNQETGGTTTASFFQKAVQHLVLAAHVFISPQLEATVGYNHLRRTDLSLGAAGNGLAGFSAGLAARFENLHVSFARSAYQRGAAYNQLGLNLLLNRFFGAGKF